ncbi:MAG: hypothetical protein ACK5T0_04740 [Vampirovibrionales bacterium]
MLEKIRPSTNYTNLSQVVTQRTAIETQKALDAEKRDKYASRKSPLATFDIHTTSGTVAAVLAMSAGVALQMNERHKFIQRLQHVLSEEKKHPKGTAFIAYARQDLKDATSLFGRLAYGYRLLSAGIVPGMGVGVIVNGLDYLWAEYRGEHEKKSKSKKM